MRGDSILITAGFGSGVKNLGSGEIRGARKIIRERSGWPRKARNYGSVLEVNEWVERTHRVGR